MSNTQFGERETNTPEKLRFGTVLDEIAAEAGKNYATGGPRFEALRAAFEDTFQENSSLRAYAEAINWALLDVPLTLFYLGFTPAVIVELHGLLEHFARRDLVRHLCRDAASKHIIETLLERTTLKDTAPLLMTLGIWDATDIKFTCDLGCLRNGIAHKNADRLSKRLASGKKLWVGEAEALVYKEDWTSYIIKTIRLLAKLAVANSPGTPLGWVSDGYSTGGQSL